MGSEGTVAEVIEEFEADQAEDFWICTCQYVSERFMHHVDCELWYDEHFALGIAYWDEEAESLAPAEGRRREAEEWEQVMTTMNTPCVAAVDPDEEEALPSCRCLCSDADTRSYCPACGVFWSQQAGGWVPLKLRTDREHKGGKVYACTCKPEEAVNCTKCEVQWDYGLACWSYWNPNTTSVTTGTGKGHYGTWDYTRKCRHYQQRVEFPNGSVIFASSRHIRATNDDKVDLGIYMCSSWDPTSLAWSLPWQDYGLPQLPDEDVSFLIDFALDWADAGKRIEVGCMGGHGRTGSLLALMALHCGVSDPKEAVKWVRANYCEEAIEGAKQEWYVEKFAAVMAGEDPPPMPEPPPKPKVEPKNLVALAQGSKASEPEKVSSSGYKVWKFDYDKQLWRREVHTDKGSVYTTYHKDYGGAAIKVSSTPKSNDNTKKKVEVGERETNSTPCLFPVIASRTKEGGEAQ